MRPAQTALRTLVLLTAAANLGGCDGCRGRDGMSEQERTKLLASAIATPRPAPSASAVPVDGIGHAANVIPGQGPKRVSHDAPRLGLPYPILPGEGVGPLRFGANRKTIERLMGAPCDDATDTMCRYVGRAMELKLQNGVVTEMRLSRKGREAKRAADGSIIEYGFFNGALRPDLYFGMHPAAIQQHLGAPQKIEKIQPLGPDGFAERHLYDGATLEYDQWSNGNLVLGAIVLTESKTAAVANAKLEAELAKRAAERAELRKRTPPTRDPR